MQFVVVCRKVEKLDTVGRTNRTDAQKSVGLKKLIGFRMVLEQATRVSDLFQTGTNQPNKEEEKNAHQRAILDVCGALGRCQDADEQFSHTGVIGHFYLSDIFPLAASVHVCGNVEQLRSGVGDWHHLHNSSEQQANTPAQYINSVRRSQQPRRSNFRTSTRLAGTRPVSPWPSTASHHAESTETTKNNAVRQAHSAAWASSGCAGERLTGCALEQSDGVALCDRQAARCTFHRRYGCQKRV